MQRQILLMREAEIAVRAPFAPTPFLVPFEGLENCRITALRMIHLAMPLDTCFVPSHPGAVDNCLKREQK